MKKWQLGVWLFSQTSSSSSSWRKESPPTSACHLSIMSSTHPHTHICQVRVWRPTRVSSCLLKWLWKQSREKQLIVSQLFMLCFAAWLVFFLFSSSGKTDFLIVFSVGVICRDVFQKKQAHREVESLYCTCWNSTEVFASVIKWNIISQSLTSLEWRLPTALQSAGWKKGGSSQTALPLVDHRGTAHWTGVIIVGYNIVRNSFTPQCMWRRLHQQGSQDSRRVTELLLISFRYRSHTVEGCSTFINICTKPMHRNNSHGSIIVFELNEK